MPAAETPYEIILRLATTTRVLAIARDLETARTLASAYADKFGFAPGILSSWRSGALLLTIRATGARA